LTAGQDYWLEAKLVRNNGSNRTIDFRVSTNAADLAQDDGDAVTGWTAHGTQITGTTIGVLFATDVPLRTGLSLTGGTATGHFTGRVYAAQVKDATTTIASPVWSGTNNTVIADTQSNLWTCGSAATQTVGTGGTGVEVINAAHSGSVTEYFADAIASGSTAVSDLADWFSPPTGLVILALSGTNEYAADINPETFRTNLQIIVNEIRATDSDVPILFVLWYKPFSATPRTYDWSDYNDVTRDIIATTTYASCIDFSPTSNWPQPTTNGSPVDPSGLYYDGYHPGTAGHAAIAVRMLYQLRGVPCSSIPTLEAA
jgi:lysophospholipase L1-like esterase